MPRVSPVEQVRRRAAALGEPAVGVPRGYERYGDVLVVKMDAKDAPTARGRALGRAYAETLGVSVVLADVGGIDGELRAPRTVRLWGEGSAVGTQHEGDIAFRFDAERVMFSSGNQEERLRLRREDLTGRTVADLCAGIGYWTLPAVRAGAERVVAVEKNPEAFRWLEENVRRNGAAGRVEARMGDCRVVGPTGVADLVILGYLHGTWGLLPAGLAALRPEGGRIVFHETCRVEHYPEVFLRRLTRLVEAEGWRVRAARPRVVKSFAPRIDHVSFDVELAP